MKKHKHCYWILAWLPQGRVGVKGILLPGNSVINTLASRNVEQHSTHHVSFNLRNMNNWQKANQWLSLITPVCVTWFANDCMQSTLQLCYRISTTVNKAQRWFAACFRCTDFLGCDWLEYLSYIQVYIFFQRPVPFCDVVDEHGALGERCFLIVGLLINLF